MNAEIAKDLLRNGDLDSAGAEIGLARATRAGGHAFDEDDDSYGRRLRAELVGAEAAGAVSRPASNDHRVGFRPLGVKTAADAIEALQKFHPDTVVTSLVLSLLPTADTPAPPATLALRQDGPTVEEWVMAGYDAEAYPPRGYASRSTEAEIQAAVMAQNAARSHIPHAPEEQNNGGSDHKAPEKTAPDLP